MEAHHIKVPPYVQLVGGKWNNYEFFASIILLLFPMKIAGGHANGSLRADDN